MAALLLRRARCSSARCPVLAHLLLISTLCPLRLCEQSQQNQRSSEFSLLLHKRIVTPLGSWFVSPCHWLSVTSHWLSVKRHESLAGSLKKKGPEKRWAVCEAMDGIPCQAEASDDHTGSSWAEVLWRKGRPSR